jgi:heme exporter protein B
LVREIIRNIRKDLCVDLREKSAVNIAFAFAFISTLAVSLVAGGAALGARERALLFWLIMFFSAMSGLSHIFVREEERGTSLFLRLSSGPHAVLTAKLLFNMVFFLALQTVIAPLFVFFMEGSVASPAGFALSVLAGGAALASSATVLSAMAAKSGARGALFTVISFPIMLPVLMTAAGATAASLETPGHLAGRETVFLLAFSGAMIAVSYLVFEYIWIDE